MTLKTITALFKIDSIYFCLGFFSTTSLLSFINGSTIIPIYSILMVIILVHLLFFSKKTLIYKYSKLDEYYFYWIAFGCVSCIWGMVYFDDILWRKAAIGSLPKIILYTFFFVLLIKSRFKEKYVDLILKGIIYGCVINCIWATVDSAYYYSTGISITNNLFTSYIEASQLHYDMVSIIRDGSIRSCGLNMDPANIGLMAPVLAGYSLRNKNILLYLLSLVSVLASISITALLSCVAVTAIYLIRTRMTSKGVIFIVSILIIGIIILSSNNKILNTLISAAEDRTEYKIDSGGAGDEKRTSYWTNFLPAVLKTPQSLIIGTGYNTAAYAYINNNLVRANRFTPYDPEQTYFSMYFNVGLIGWIFFILLLYGIWKRLKHIYSIAGKTDNCIIMLAGIEGSAIAFLGYHYTVYSVFMLILLCSLVNLDYRRAVSKNAHLLINS